MKKKSIELCIFDLDGVVVDTAKYHYVAWEQIADSFSYDLTKKKNELLKGVSRVQSLDLILEWAEVVLSSEKKDQLLIDKNDFYINLIDDLKPDAVFDGFVEFVMDLKKNNVKISLGSASKNAIPILEKLEIMSLFDFIVDGNMTTRSKPDPQVFQMSCKHFNIDPNNSIVFEDAPKGVEAAIKGGMYVVGIGEEEDLNQAHIVWNDFEGKGIDELDF